MEAYLRGSEITHVRDSGSTVTVYFHANVSLEIDELDTADFDLAQAVQNRIGLYGCEVEGADDYTIH